MDYKYLSVPEINKKVDSDYEKYFMHAKSSDFFSEPNETNKILSLADLLDLKRLEEHEDRLGELRFIFKEDHELNQARIRERNIKINELENEMKEIKLKLYERTSICCHYENLYYGVSNQLAIERNEYQYHLSKLTDELTLSKQISSQLKKQEEITDSSFTRISGFSHHEMAIDCPLNSSPIHNAPNDDNEVSGYCTSEKESINYSIDHITKHKSSRFDSPRSKTLFRQKNGTHNHLNGMKIEIKDVLTVNEEKKGTLIRYFRNIANKITGNHAAKR